MTRLDHRSATNKKSSKKLFNNSAIRWRTTLKSSQTIIHKFVKKSFYELEINQFMKLFWYGPCVNDSMGSGMKFDQVGFGLGWFQRGKNGMRPIILDDTQ